MQSKRLCLFHLNNVRLYLSGFDWVTDPSEPFPLVTEVRPESSVPFLEPDVVPSEGRELRARKDAPPGPVGPPRN